MWDEPKKLPCTRALQGHSSSEKELWNSNPLTQEFFIFIFCHKLIFKNLQSIPWNVFQVFLMWVFLSILLIRNDGNESHQSEMDSPLKNSDLHNSITNLMKVAKHLLKRSWGYFTYQICLPLIWLSTAKHTVWRRLFGRFWSISKLSMLNRNFSNGLLAISLSSLISWIPIPTT